MNQDTRSALHRMAAQQFPHEDQTTTDHSAAVSTPHLPRLGSGVEPLHAAPTPSPPTWSRRLVPAAAAVAVVLTAGGAGAWWATGSASTGVQPATTGAAGAGSTAIVSTTHAASTTAGGRYRPPPTPAALEATLSRILAGTATVSVTDTSPTGAATASSLPTVPALPPVGAPPADAPPLPVPDPTRPAPTPDDGAAIVGTITNADGTTGGFDLTVFAGAQPDASACTSDVTDCTITPRPDGSTLAVGHHSDQSVTGAITYEVHLVRPDGANIWLHLSNQSDPKGHSATLSDHAPLTLAQMTDLVTSSQW